MKTVAVTVEWRPPVRSNRSASGYGRIETPPGIVKWGAIRVWSNGEPFGYGPIETPPITVELGPFRTGELRNLQIETFSD